MALASQGDPTSYLEGLPNEILLNVSESLAPQDKITMAMAYPTIFMNYNRVNIFAIDAHKHISHETYRHLEAYINTNLGWPLIIEAISGNELGRGHIERILDIYEEVCVERGIHPHTFLSSTFRRYDQGLTPTGIFCHLPIRTVFSPLHMAVIKDREDLVDYLMKRGADAAVTAYPEGTPLECAFWLSYEIEPEKFERRRRQSGQWRRRHKPLHFGGWTYLEENAILLSNSSPNTAYLPDLSAISPEMRGAYDVSMDRLACRLLERFNNSGQAGNLKASAIEQRDDLLFDCIRVGNMPLTTRLLLEQGANCRQRHGHHIDLWCLTIPFSHFNLALYYGPGCGRFSGPAAVLRSEIETAGFQTPRTELAQSLVTLANFARRDSEMAVLDEIVNELFETGHVEGLQLLLWYSIAGGKKSAGTRKGLLLRALKFNGIAMIALRHAICYRNWPTVDAILEHMSDNEESIDERLAGHRDYDPQHAIWHETPLAVALAQKNYLAAAKLLTAGADPGKVPVHIRHRVHNIEQEVKTGHIADLKGFVFGNGIANDRISITTISTTDADARTTLEFVFERILRDPAHPLEPLEGCPEKDSDHKNLLGMLNKMMVPKVLAVDTSRSVRPVALVGRWNRL
ncbi:hypothetical protein F5Y14DRAFT_463305 [Nemania sp. NC0429]|nr:hypothetical protein F5Y14DRAFT_463305 [Nemania sp. NC0429]